jgi:oligopeptide/dipeptide ABC transporter ATP-binding protein
MTLPAVAPEPPVLVEARGLSKTFSRRAGPWLPRAIPVAAVTDVDLDLATTESFALVGESGCGKTTLGRLLVRLIEPSAGRVRFAGRDITRLPASALRPLRRELQMVFQDPAGSLDPRMRVGAAIEEPLVIHRLATGEGLRRRRTELLERVGLPAATGERFPSELSGGQRQRVAIARALATEPRLLVADEPVTALDASVRAQIVNLIAQLQQDLGLTLLFIGHDLTVVEQMADRVAVMFASRLVEVAPGTELFEQPLHPYSVALLAAVPRFERSRTLRRSGPAAELPASPPHGGCAFRERCPIAVARCAVERPALSPVGGGRMVACHRPGELAAPGRRAQDP